METQEKMLKNTGGRVRRCDIIRVPEGVNIYFKEAESFLELKFIN